MIRQKQPPQESKNSEKPPKCFIKKVKNQEKLVSLRNKLTFANIMNNHCSSFMEKPGLLFQGEFSQHFRSMRKSKIIAYDPLTGDCEGQFY